MTQRLLIEEHEPGTPEGRDLLNLDITAREISMGGIPTIQRAGRAEAVIQDDGGDAAHQDPTLLLARPAHAAETEDGGGVGTCRKTGTRPAHNAVADATTTGKGVAEKGPGRHVGTPLVRDTAALREALASLFAGKPPSLPTVSGGDNHLL